MRLFDKLINYGLFLFIVLLPWQTRWIFKEASLGGGVFEYGRFSLYASEIVLLVILALTVFKSLVGRKSINHKPLSMIDYRLWIFLLIIWSTVTIIWSADKLLAWYGLLKLVEGVGLFWLITNRVRQAANGSPMNHEFTNKITISLIISGLIQALFGLYQFATQIRFPANKWLGLARLDAWDSGVSVIEFLDERWLRAYGSLPHPNILGGFLAICLIVIIINLFKAEREQKWRNIFYWFSLVVIFLGLLASFSRSAWLGFGIIFLYLICRSLIKKQKKTRLTGLTSLGILALLAIIFLMIFPYQLFTTRIKHESRLEQKSLTERQTAYGQFFSVVKDNWYKGTGLGNYLLVVYQINPDLQWFEYQPVHDANLLAFAELGVAGLVLYILIIISILKNRSDYWMMVIGLLLISVFDHYFRSLYFGIMLWWLVMALSYQPKEKLMNS